MIKMKRMNHILRSIAVLPMLAAVLLAPSCSKNKGENANEAAKRQFEAWRSLHYPAAVEKDGIYIIDETPGNGLEWLESMPVTFMTYTIRSLDGTISYNTDERWARQLGNWDQTYYYGPQTVITGKDYSYAGMDAMLDGMREGGSRTAIIPSWMLTYDRYGSSAEYEKHETDATPMIYTITFLGQAENFGEYELENLRSYASRNWQVSDTLSTGAVFFKSFTEFDSEPVEMRSDTTVYINYIGRRISDGQVFDTNIADTAKFYHIYNSSRNYAPVSVTWADKADEIKMNQSSIISGFAIGLFNMHADEKASFAFGNGLGYGSSGGKDTHMVPPYASLRFDVEMVPEP